MVRTGFNLITVLIFFFYIQGHRRAFLDGGREAERGGEMGKFTGINSRVPYVKRLIPLI